MGARREAALAHLCYSLALKTPRGRIWSTKGPLLAFPMWGVTAIPPAPGVGGTWPGGTRGRKEGRGSERRRAPPSLLRPTAHPRSCDVVSHRQVRTAPEGRRERGDRLIYRWEPPPARRRRRREGRGEPPRSPGAVREGGRDAPARRGAQPLPPPGRDSGAGLGPGGLSLRGGGERRGAAEVRRAAPRSAPPARAGPAAGPGARSQPSPPWCSARPSGGGAGAQPAPLR